MCADILPSHHFEPIYEVFSILACPDVQRASSSMKKVHFLQGSCVAVASVPLAEPCVLSQTIREDTISNELHVEARKKHLRNIFDLPPQKMCYLLLCF